MSNVWVKFCLVWMTACVAQIYFTGNLWVLAIGVAGCYFGWLVDTAGKAFDSKIKELQRRRIGGGNKALPVT